MSSISGTEGDVIESKTSLPKYKSDFMADCLSGGCLTFGTFTLKSGRVSPYFFNIGVFHQASLLRSLATALAHTIAEMSLKFDVLFGPAYKGIPLCTSALLELAQLDEKTFGNVSYAFNRKEKKAYGDGGSIVGSNLEGKRVLIIDDVITAGSAIKEAMEIISAQKGQVVGIVVAMDRMERAPQPGEDPTSGEIIQGPSTIGEIRKTYNIPVVAVLTLDDIIEGYRVIGSNDDIRRMEEYRSRYKATN